MLSTDHCLCMLSVLVSHCSPPPFSQTPIKQCRPSCRVGISVIAPSFPVGHRRSGEKKPRVIVVLVTKKHIEAIVSVSPPSEVMRVPGLFGSGVTGKVNNDGRVRHPTRSEGKGSSVRAFWGEVVCWWWCCPRTRAGGSVIRWLHLSAGTAW